MENHKGLITRNQVKLMGLNDWVEKFINHPKNPCSNKMNLGVFSPENLNPVKKMRINA